MAEPGRRRFLGGTLAAAGWMATAGWPASPARGPRPREGATGAAPAPAPPSRRFLDAVAAGDLPAVRAALDADPGLLHARDAEGRSAFALALLRRRAEVAALLRERGHRPDLHEAALALDWERFDELAAPAPGLLNRDHPVGGTAMYAAAYGGAGSDLWRVYAQGAEPDVAPRGAEGQSALRAAFEHPDLPTAELSAATLLANGASPNLPERDGDGALHAAAARGSVEIVEMLVRKGAIVDARDAAGRTPLDRAREAGHGAVVALLGRAAELPRDRSTSRRAYDVEGRPYRAPDLSAFSVAARGGIVGEAHRDADAVRRTLERHPELAHAVATTDEGAVEAAAHMGRADIAEPLLERGAPCSLLTATMLGDAVRVRALLDEDPLRIHERGPHDFALLWYPVIGGERVDLAELLLERGAEPERQHYLGTTALHFAAARGQRAMVELLLAHGADPRRRGRKFSAEGQTPIDLAAARGHDDVARLLRGA